MPKIPHLNSSGSRSPTKTRTKTDPQGDHSESSHSREVWTLTTTFKRLLPYAKPYRKQFFWGFCSIVATNLIGVAGPWVLKYAIEDLQIKVTTEKISLYAGLIVAIALVAGVFRYLMRRIIVSVSRHIEYDLRIEYFAHLQRLSPSFYDHQQTGDLMTRATSDVEAVRMIIGPAVMYFADTLLTSAFALSLMFVLSVKLTLYILALAPILSFLIYFLAKKIHLHSLRSQERYSELNALIQEHLTGIRVVRSYVQEESERRLFQEGNKKYLDASMRLVQLQAMLIPFFYSIFGVGLALVLYIGGQAIITGAFSLGDFVAFSAYVAMLAWPVMAVGWVINLYQRGSASVQRLQTILQTSPDIADTRAIVALEGLKGQIDFHNVCFTYPGSGTPALRDLTLHIPTGSSLGIVGAVGAGKSSLGSLLSRLYEVSSGDLRIDGQNVKDIPLAVLRRDIAVVPQDSFLFSDQLDQNILFAEAPHPEGYLERIADVAGLNRDLDNFPQGFKTWVGERGITLSGGQKQRASLARALAADPRIIILDDCFSSVDTRTEAEILTKIRPYLAGRTVILIAHRISTLQWADQIIVLKAGRIAEKGTHQELLEQEGWYAAMYHQQLLEEQLEAKDTD